MQKPEIRLVSYDNCIVYTLSGSGKIYIRNKKYIYIYLFVNAFGGTVISVLNNVIFGSPVGFFKHFIYSVCAETIFVFYGFQLFKGQTGAVADNKTSFPVF